MDLLFIFLSSHSSGWEAFLTGGLTALLFGVIYVVVNGVKSFFQSNRKDWEEIKKDDND